MWSGGVRASARFLEVSSCRLLRSGRHCCSSDARCPFETLGLRQGAPEAAIKKAYFHLAKKCHPDVYAAADAQQRFQDISRAYALLTDEQARHAYEARAGIYRHGETSGKDKDIFERVFQDHRLRNPVQAAEERALHAIMEAAKGNDRLVRDFCVDYRVPPQYFLPKKAQLEADPGDDSAAPLEQEGAESRPSISDFFSRRRPTGGA